MEKVSTLRITIPLLSKKNKPKEIKNGVLETI